MQHTQEGWRKQLEAAARCLRSQGFRVPRHLCAAMFGARSKKSCQSMESIIQGEQIHAVSMPQHAGALLRHGAARCRHLRIGCSSSKRFEACKVYRPRRGGKISRTPNAPSVPWALAVGPLQVPLGHALHCCGLPPREGGLSRPQVCVCCFLFCALFWVEVSLGASP